MTGHDYNICLLTLRAQLTATIVRERERARAHSETAPLDAGDASVADEEECEEFTEADLAAAVLQQVNNALRRIAEGTFGRCVVDGRPISQARLEVIPWTPYCLKHQKLLEAASRPIPTL